MSTLIFFNFWPKVKIGVYQQQQQQQQQCHVGFRMMNSSIIFFQGVLIFCSDVSIRRSVLLFKINFFIEGKRPSNAITVFPWINARVLI